MRFEMNRPCANCPFRTDVPPFLGVTRAQEIVSYAMGDKTFACHKTVVYDDEDGEPIRTRDEQQCAGAMIIRAKNGKLGSHQMYRIAHRLGILTNAETLDLTSPVYPTPEAMIEAYRRTNA